MSIQDDTATAGTAISAFCDGLGIRLVRVGEGEAEVSMTLGPGHANRSGRAHGGIAYILIDTACGFAATLGHDGDPDARALTLQLAISYQRALPPDGEIRAVARVTGGGRTTLFCDAHVYDGEGRLAATGQGCFKRVLNRPKTG